MNQSCYVGYLKFCNKKNGQGKTLSEIIVIFNEVQKLNKLKHKRKVINYKHNFDSFFMKIDTNMF